MISIKTFDKYFNHLNELKNLDYSSYNTPINLDKFKELYQGKKPTMSRFVQCNSIEEAKQLPEFILCNPSQHELRFDEQRKHDYIYYHIIDKSKRWTNFPNKYRSIYFHCGIVPHDHNSNVVLYYMIPIGEGKIGISDNFVGKKHFRFCKVVNNIYENIFNEPINYDEPETTINCLKKLNDIKDTKSSTKWVTSVDFIDNSLYNPNYDHRQDFIDIKKEMNKIGTNDWVDYLDQLFDPVKNDYKLIDDSSILSYSGKPGWTDKKLLMIRSDSKHIIRNNQTISIRF